MLLQENLNKKIPTADRLVLPIRPFLSVFLSKLVKMYFRVCKKQNRREKLKQSKLKIK